MRLAATLMTVEPRRDASIVMMLPSPRCDFPRIPRLPDEVHLPAAGLAGGADGVRAEGVHGDGCVAGTGARAAVRGTREAGDGGAGVQHRRGAVGTGHGH